MKTWVNEYGVELSVDARGHAHKESGPGGGQFISKGDDAHLSVIQESAKKAVDANEDLSNKERQTYLGAIQEVTKNMPSAVARQPVQNEYQDKDAAMSLIDNSPAARILRDCLRECDGDVEAGIAAAEYIIEGMAALSAELSIGGNDARGTGGIGGAGRADFSRVGRAGSVAHLQPSSGELGTAQAVGEADGGVGGGGGARTDVDRPHGVPPGGAAHGLDAAERGRRADGSILPQPGAGAAGRGGLPGGDTTLRAHGPDHAPHMREAPEGRGGTRQLARGADVPARKDGRVGVHANAGLSIDAFLGGDIHNDAAQSILTRTLKQVRGLSAAARRDLKEALARGPEEVGEAVIDFIDKYRLQLAELLSATQLAAVLEGAVEIASRLPVPDGVPVQGLPVAEQERVVAASARPPEPIRPPAPAPTSPARVHYQTIDRAAESLASKRVMTRSEYDRLEAAARQKAFTVANVSAEETLTKIRDSLADNIREGADYETWKGKVLEDVDKGTFLSDAHQETVFRTNVQSAFSDGQMQTLQHPLVRSGFPYAAYDAIHDDRVRDNHLALEELGIQGTNIYRLDDPVFQTFRPPWDYNDRCRWTPLTVRQAAERGIREAREWLDTGVEPAVKAHVPMPPFSPPEGFQRAVSAAPLSIQLSLQPTMSFSVGRSKGRGFHRPENYDKVADLRGGKELWAGANDWESGWTWAGIHSGARDSEPERWIEVDHAKCPGCRGTLDAHKKSDARACMLFAKKKVASWAKVKSVALSTDAQGHEHADKGPHGGQFVSKGGGANNETGEVSAKTSSSKFDLPDEVKQNIENQGLIGPVAGIRHKILVDMGADPEAIKKMDKLFDQHRWGEAYQKRADEIIAATINKDTPLGKALRAQIDLEDAILRHYESRRGDLIAKKRERSRREMKEDWETDGTLKNSDAYDSWEDQWNVEEASKFEVKPLKFFRKGGLDKDVLPTSLNQKGAKSVKVIGTGSGPHFKPDHSWTSDEMRAAGYRPLGGLGYIQMGYDGEDEVTWVRVTAGEDKSLSTDSSGHEHKGRGPGGGQFVSKRSGGGGTATEDRPAPSDGSPRDGEAVHPSERGEIRGPRTRLGRIWNALFGKQQTESVTGNTFSDPLASKAVRQLLSGESSHDLRSGGLAGSYTDTMLSAILNESGRDAAPKLLSKDEVDRLIKEQGWTPAFHRFQEAEHDQQFRDGDFYSSSGLYGNGFYIASPRAWQGSEEAAIKTIPEESYGKHLMRMAIPPNARVVTYGKLKEERGKYIQELTNQYGAGKLTKDQYNKMLDVVEDLGRFGALRNYDMIDASAASGLGYMVVLNRRMLAVQANNDRPIQSGMEEQ